MGQCYNRLPSEKNPCQALKIRKNTLCSKVYNFLAGLFRNSQKYPNDNQNWSNDPNDMKERFLEKVNNIKLNNNFNF
jgi:hypothetical protein